MSRRASLCKDEDKGKGHFATRLIRSGRRHRHIVMAFSEIELKRCEKIVDAYVQRKRPPPHIRKELDISFRINGQSVEIFEVRPAWQGETGEFIEHGVFKTTYVKRSDSWKIYWLRADLKWHRYEPDAEVDTLEDALAVCERDEYGCFYG